MKTRYLFASFAMIPLTASFAMAQSDAGSVREKTESAHLIGHEDELLLRRIEDALAEWDPRQLDSPYLKRINTQEGKKYALRRPDLAEFIADPDAAVALGKALFWEMQAGSDFGRKTGDGKIYGTACASCHYRFGADARSRNTEAIAYQAWEKFLTPRPGVPDPGADTRNTKPPFSQRKQKFEPVGDKDVRADKFRFGDPDASGNPEKLNGLLSYEIVGSQGIERRLFQGLDSGTGTEKFSVIPKPNWGSAVFNMFAVGANPTRQVTGRNSPSVINAVFNDRQFHDGRAESTFNGFSIFGDFDKRIILKKAFLDENGKAVSYSPVSAAIVNASLGSQSVGPIVNEVEMSYQGRNFHDLALKLLKKQPLAEQRVDHTDSILAGYAKKNVLGLFDPKDKNKILVYRELIQRAFRKEWWADDKKLTEQSSLIERLKKNRDQVAALNNLLPDSFAILKAEVASKLADASLRFPAEAISIAIDSVAQTTPPSSELTSLSIKADEWALIEGEVLPLRPFASDNIDVRKKRLKIDEEMAGIATGGPAGIVAQDDLMVNNFSLYWGLSIMLYESTLISNDSPFDQMLRGNEKGVDAVWKASVEANALISLSTTNTNAVTLPEPATDDVIRKVNLDKLITRNSPPVLTGTGMFQRGFRMFMNNCAECHAPPFFTSAANLELAPELPEPIAKLHSHALVKVALADAVKQRLIEENQPRGQGVKDSNRNLLGARKFFFDQERIPVLEEVIAELMIENMGVDDKRPVVFTPVTVLPGQPIPDRVPMITWLGTRPPLGFAPTPQPLAKPLDPYAFYDLGFYNLGASEPRYDWGVWGFTGADSALTVEEVRTAAAFLQPKFQTLKISQAGVDALVQKVEQEANADKALAPSRQSIPSLGSAYQLQKARRNKGFAESVERLGQVTRALQAASDAIAKGVDHSAERDFLDYTNGHERKDNHFFKRARRMVMTEETWGHRKPFINDNELMGWGAFKTPSLRNVSLTEPYMHNGRFLTLRQVLSFYSFDNPDLIPADVQFNPDLHPEMGRLALNADGLIAGFPGAPINLVQIQDAESLLFFLQCLTDQSVLHEKGPFDHPSINIPNGFEGNDPAKESVFTVSEVGESGYSGTVPRSQFPTPD